MKTRLRRFWILLVELYAAYRARFLGLAVLGLLSGFVEGVGVSLLVPLFTVFIKGGAVDSNFALEAISRALSFFNLALSFRTLLIITFGAFLLKTAVLFAFGYLRARFAASYRTATRKRLYELFLGSNFSYLRRQKTGHLHHTIMFDVKQATRLFDDCVGFILSVGSSFMFLAVSFALSWQITLFTVFLGGALVFVLLPLLRRVRRYAAELLTLSKHISHSLAEALSGIKTIKALGVEREVASAARELFRRVEQSEFKKHCIKIITKLSFEPVSIIFILIVFAVSYRYLSFDLVSFIAIIYLINRVFGNLNNMQAGFSTTLESMPSAEELVTAFREVRLQRPRPRGDEHFAFERELRIEDVSFGYRSGAPALSDLSLVVRKGETLGIVGPSGAGKTTLVDLLLGLMPPSSGRIMLDGRDAQAINWLAWRRKVIYVAQEPFLLNASIRDNVRFYDRTISEPDISDACQSANLETLLATLPRGIDTGVGERGNRLSGGERQRVALARALARKPEILILDEATSALDAESERSIQDALAHLRGKVTMILIAHRLTTVLGADRIIVLDEGRIVEEGTPATLQTDKGSYLSRMLSLGHKS